MNVEDDEAMRALDARLKRLYGGLDTSPGFDARLQARIAQLASVGARPSAAAAREQLERNYARARAAADRAARIDAVAVAIGGLGSVLALWRFAPQLTQWYADMTGRLDPTLVAYGSLAAVLVAGWAMLRRFDVSPRMLVGA